MPRLLLHATFHDVVGHTDFVRPNVRKSSGTVRTKLVDRTSYGPEHELKLRCRGPLTTRRSGTRHCAQFILV